MPKDDTKPQAPESAAPAVTPAAAPAALPAEPPRLGEIIQVKPAAGLQLINNEAGTEFAPDVATAQTVTITTLRRLADGDLIRV